MIDGEGGGGGGGTPLAYIKFTEFYKKLWSRVPRSFEVRCIWTRTNSSQKAVMAEHSPPCAVRVLWFSRGCSCGLRFSAISRCVTSLWRLFEEIYYVFSFKWRKGFRLSLINRSVPCCFSAQLSVITEPSAAGVPCGLWQFPVPEFLVLNYNTIEFLSFHTVVFQEVCKNREVLCSL